MQGRFSEMNRPVQDLPGMANELSGCTVAILVTDGFEQIEMTEPRRALESAGARTVLIAPQGKSAPGQVQGVKHGDRGDKFPVDTPLASADAKTFDALLLPGGVANPDRLRMNPEAVKFVQNFLREEKPVAAICHGPWMIVEAGGAKGRTMTSWPSLKTDITNAGGKWVDKEVVRDGNLVTSRKPDDLPAFDREMVAAFAGSLAHAHR